MDKVNSSVVSEFVLLGLSSSQKLQLFFFVFFSVLYVIIVLGNLLVIITVTSDPSLHNPMYFLLGNLSFVDICQASFATPKMIADFLSEHKTISFSGCIAQIFFIHLFTGGEMVLLVSMAYDRYVAICKPLHYLVIMSQKTCTVMVIISWAVGLVHTLSQLSFTVNLPFCGPNVVDSFFCDLPRVTKLACLDSYKIEILIVVNSGILSLSTFSLLVTSYIIILVTVWFKSSAAMAKAFSTLAAHITVVMLFFGPCIFIYVWPFTTYPVDKVLAVFYTIFTPILNPIIYTLRNRDMKAAMRKTMTHYLRPNKRRDERQAQKRLKIHWWLLVHSQRPGLGVTELHFDYLLLKRSKETTVSCHGIVPLLAPHDAVHLNWGTMIIFFCVDCVINGLDRNIQEATFVNKKGGIAEKEANMEFEN
ncbi:olfactory receptor 4K5 [Tupaia chinensis]|uniref:olfactory receptor 4K5 n=1 Tax=Tupaia chinensis TaxID=246437 RepID=UPI0003C9003E|nr:olfactory receptor 4K5 [Tupaia chinensis]